MTTVWSLHASALAAAILASLSCSMLGVFLLLRRQSLIGDAISHSVLPGIAAAFLLTGSRNIFPMFIGAGICGLLTAFLSQALNQHCKVDRSAALGIVFTSLFAFGVILMRQAADLVDLDPACVLFGSIEFTDFDRVELFGLSIPRAPTLLLGLLIVNVCLVVTFFKEIAMASFDESFSSATGFSASKVHYLLMTLVAATCVASFESVGAVLVVAMFIVPAAIARMCSDRLLNTVLTAMLASILIAIAGYWSAVEFEAPVAAMMSVVGGVLLIAVIFLAPRYGLVRKWFQRASLRYRIIAEDLLGFLYRKEREQASESAAPSTGEKSVGVFASFVQWTLKQRNFIVSGTNGEPSLSKRGVVEAERIVRAHRLWESYLVEHMNLQSSHVHDSAALLEHHTSRELEQALEAAVHSELDPHGRPIPPASTRET